jgi:dihydroneopterin aldolase
MNRFAQLDGLVPDDLRPRTRKIVLEDYSLDVDIGFHDFEVGRPQRLLLTVEVWVDEASFPDEDEAAGAWNYDFLRDEIAALAKARRTISRKPWSKRSTT